MRIKFEVDVELHDIPEGYDDDYDLREHIKHEISDAVDVIVSAQRKAIRVNDVMWEMGGVITVKGWHR